ncbi:hypothetical protein [Desulfosporosinus fructosivorans]|uniref:hypothetical protein n=1 Tax=Desulfosporosinus fructosivorans TaxID=2018669 RepID=UPI001A7EC6C8|nr:hypothetical protein [Desulfosporosinus fructosivorans]
MATTHAKGVGACEHGPSGLRSTEEERGTACFQRCWKSGRRRNAWHGDVCVAWGRFVCHGGRLSKVRVTPPRAVRSSCQTRALILLARGQDSRPMRRPCRRAGGKRPVSRPADERGLKPSLATTHAKGVGACERGPLGWGRRG